MRFTPGSASLARLSNLASIASTLALGGCQPPHGGRMAELTHVVVVVGSGESRGRPDLVRVTVGVEAVDGNPAAAIATMNSKMRAVLDALKANGVAEKDLQTNQFSIYSEQPPAPPTPYPYAAAAPPLAEARVVNPSAKVASAPPASGSPPRPEITYRVTNTVLATVRQVDRAGVILGAALQSGANQANGIQFDLENKKPLEDDDARAKAVADARHRAEDLARLSGVHLGRILNVSEGNAGEPGPSVPYAFKMAAQSSTVPTEEGQIVVHQDVRVVFQIKK